MVGLVFLYSVNVLGVMCVGRQGVLKLLPPVPITPASAPFTVGVPAFLFYLYCKLLHNITKFFSFSPGSHHFGNPASRPLSAHLLHTSRPLFSWAPAPCPPPLVWPCFVLTCCQCFQVLTTHFDESLLKSMEGITIMRTLLKSMATAK